MTQVRVNSQLRCPYCHDALVGAGRKTGCEACFAWHHSACIAELGRCANCGAQTPPPRTPPLEFERARLNDLLKKGCTAQGCRSIETIRVGLVGYQCRRHLSLSSGIQLVIAVLCGLTAPFVMAIAYSERAHLDGGELLAFLFLFAVVCLGSGLLAWRSRSTRAALKDFAQREEAAFPRGEAQSSGPEFPTDSASATLKSPKLSA